MKRIYKVAREIYKEARENYPHIKARDMKEYIAELLSCEANMVVQDHLAGEYGEEYTAERRKQVKP